MRMHLRRLAPLAILILAGACDESPTEPGDAPLSLETVVQYSFSGFSSAQQQAIRNDDDWARVWETMYAGSSPQPSRPAIDFDRKMALLAAAGPGSNSCFEVEITGAMRKADGSLEVEITASEPGPSCVCLDVVSHPAHLVTLERVDGPERFMLRRKQLDC